MPVPPTQLVVPSGNRFRLQPLLQALGGFERAPDVIDLGQIEFVTPVHQAVLTAWALALRAREPGWRPQVIPPHAREASGFARRSGWLDTLRGTSTEADWDSGMPLRVIREAAQGSRIADELTELVAKKSRLPANQYGPLAELFGELIDNAVRHAEAEPLGVVAAQYFEDERRLRGVIADTGIGVAASFARADAEDIRRIGTVPRCNLLYATEAGVTSKAGAHTGIGLFVTSQALRLNGGRLQIVSGRESLRSLSRGKVLRLEPVSTLWQGTVISFEIRTDAPLDLDRAHEYFDDPSAGRWPRTEVALALYGESLVTRERGSAFREDLDLLRRRGASLEVSLAGVRAASASFLDEAFVKPDATGRPVLDTLEVTHASDSVRTKLAMLRRHRGFA